MRTIKILSVFAVVASLFFAASSFALLANTEYIDFTGWDDTLIDNGPGQTFFDVFPSTPGVDVFVQATGDFSRESRFAAGWISDALRNPNEADNFRFTFSQSIPELVIKMATVDRQEAVDVIGVGPEMYFHDSGAFPNLVPIGGAGLAVIGDGVGQGPAGAAMGEVTTGAQMGLPVLVRHRNLFNFADKFEFFMVGKIVPEPGSFSLFGLGLLGLLGLRKRG